MTATAYPNFVYTIDGSEPAQSGTAQWATDSVSIAINPDAVAGHGREPPAL
jgi:hypothetical protein